MSRKNFVDGINAYIGGDTNVILDIRKNFDSEMRRQKNDSSRGEMLEIIGKFHTLYFDADYDLYDLNLIPIYSIMQFDIGIGGKHGAGMHAVDHIKRPSKFRGVPGNIGWVFGSMKLSNSGWNDMEGAKLKDRAENIFSKNVQYDAYTGSEVDSPLGKHWNGFTDVHDRSWFRDVYSWIYDLLSEYDFNIADMESVMVNKIQLTPLNSSQDWIIHKTLRTLQIHDNVAIHAVPRVGKTFIFGMLAEKLRSRVTVNLSMFPTNTFGQWKAMVNVSKYFADAKVFSTDDRDFDLKRLDVSLKNGDKVFINLALQSANDKVLKVLSKYNIDIIGFDEYHHGGQTDRTKNILNTLKSTKTIYLSGTLDELISKGILDRNAIVEWTDLDNYMMKRRDNQKMNELRTWFPKKYRNADMYGDDYTEKSHPTMNLYWLDRDDALANILDDQGIGDHESTLRKIFGREDRTFNMVHLLLGGPLHPHALDEDIFGERGTEGRMPTPYDALMNGAYFAAVFLADRNEQKNFVRACNIFKKTVVDKRGKHRGVMSEFEAIMFNSENEMIDEDGNVIKGESLDSKLPLMIASGKKYILVFVGQGTTGVTIPDCAAVIIGRNVDSFKLWKQICFRVMTGSHRVLKRHVFDLSSGKVFVDNISKMMDNQRASVNQAAEDDRRILMDECINVHDRFGRIDYNGLMRLIRETWNGNVEKIASKIDNDFSSYSLVDIPSGYTFQKTDGTRAKAKEIVIGQKSKGKSFKPTMKEKKEIEQEATQVAMQREIHSFIRWIIEITATTAPKGTVTCFDDLMDYVNDLEIQEKILYAIYDFSGETIDFDSFAPIWKVLNGWFENKVTKRYMDITLGMIDDSLNGKNLMKGTNVINDIIGINEIAKKHFGEVFTPMDIVKQMLDHYDPSDWSDPNKIWLDNSCGSGAFLWGGLVKRLYDGLANVIPDEKKRKRHIAGMIYGIDIQDLNIAIARKFLATVLGEENLDIIEKNIVKHDALTFNYSELKGANVVGNPPYNAGLDLKFLKMIIEDIEAETCVIVHPSTYMIDRKGSSRYNNIKHLLDGKLKSAKLFNGNKTFDIGLFVPVLVIHYDRNYDGLCEVDYFGETFETDVWNITKFGSNWGTIVKPFMEKMINVCDEEGSVWDHKTEDRKEASGKHYVQLAAIRGHVVTNGSSDNLFTDDFYTLVMKDSDKNRGIRRSSMDKTQHNVYRFNTKREQDNFIEFCKTDFVRFCLSLTKNTPQLCRGEMSIIPWMDFTKSWTDEELYRLFDIDQKTQDYIRSFLPDFYGIKEVV